MCGSITFDELRRMPLRQYIILKKAVAIESLIARRVNIYDINRAFHDPSPLFRQLEKEMSTLLRENNGKSKNVSTVSWGKDPDWKKQLSKFQV